MRDFFQAPLLERLGAITYSLYLVHHPMRYAFKRLTREDPTDSLEAWLLSVALALGGAAVFYWIVERPSHHLARSLYRRVRRPALDPALQAAVESV